jgi:hypothetical protein
LDNQEDLASVWGDNLVDKTTGYVWAEGKNSTPEMLTNKRTDQMEITIEHHGGPLSLDIASVQPNLYVSKGRVGKITAQVTVKSVTRPDGEKVDLANKSW